MRALVLALGAALLLLGACTADEPETASPPADEPADPQDPSPTGDADAPAGEEPEPETPAAPSEAPAAAEDPETLARQITEAEQTIRSDEAGEAELAAAGHLQQAAYRHLARVPEWHDPVRALVPPELAEVVAAHVQAAIDLGALTTPQAQLPAWRIIEPPPPDELLAYYREAQEVFGVGWEYLASIHLVETRMGRIQGTSPAGAQGPMQFMPGTWAAYGEGDVNNPRDAILAAGRYLAASGAPANMDGALFAYNRSNAYVRAISTYAAHMRADPRTFGGYYHWQVYYRTVDGDRLLPVGYDGSV